MNRAPPHSNRYHDGSNLWKCLEFSLLYLVKYYLQTAIYHRVVTNPKASPDLYWLMDAVSQQFRRFLSVDGSMYPLYSSTLHHSCIQELPKKAKLGSMCFKTMNHFKLSRHLLIQLSSDFINLLLILLSFSVNSHNQSSMSLSNNNFSLKPVLNGPWIHPLGGSHGPKAPPAESG